jgi:hypothetical protein
LTLPSRQQLPRLKNQRNLLKVRLLKEMLQLKLRAAQKFRATQLRIMMLLKKMIKEKSKEEIIKKLQKKKLLKRNN